MEYLNPSARVEFYNFRDCRMSTCFDISRFVDQKSIKVYVKSQTIDFNTHGENNMEHYISKYGQDLAAINALRTRPKQGNRVKILLVKVSYQINLSGPNENLGMNHLNYNLYSSSWLDHPKDVVHTNAVNIAGPSSSLTHNRTGFDMSPPLDEESIEDNPTNTNDSERTYILTFKGRSVFLVEAVKLAIVCITLTINEM